jgi:hypothetical protein
MTNNQTKGYLALVATQLVALVLAVIIHVLMRGPNVSDVGVRMYSNEENGFAAGCFAIFVVSAATILLLRRNWLQNNRIFVTIVTVLLMMLTIGLFSVVESF